MMVSGRLSVHNSKLENNCNKQCDGLENVTIFKIIIVSLYIYFIDIQMTEQTDNQK